MHWPHLRVLLLREQMILDCTTDKTADPAGREMIEKNVEIQY